MPELHRKSVPFDLREIKAAEDGSGWEIAGYASTYGDPPDAYGDVIAPGAFADSMATRKTKLLYEHYEPIGKELELRDDPHGLWGRWSVVDTRAGSDAHKLAVAGVLDSLSIGYWPDAWETRDDGVRVLTKVTLLEVSAVALPANEQAVVTGVKRADQAPPEPPPPPPPADPDPLAFDLPLLRRRLLALGVPLTPEGSSHV